MTAQSVVEIILGVALIAVSIAAQTYRDQRDNLAAAWIHYHPEDFPDLESDD